MEKSRFSSEEEKDTSCFSKAFTWALVLTQPPGHLVQGFFLVLLGERVVKMART